MSELGIKTKYPLPDVVDLDSPEGRRRYVPEYVPKDRPPEGIKPVAFLVRDSGGVEQLVWPIQLRAGQLAAPFMAVPLYTCLAPPSNLHRVWTAEDLIKEPYDEENVLLPSQDSYTALIADFFAALAALHPPNREDPNG